MRRECKRPFRIYRPGFVVGHSKTGEIDKIDGPYYFFKTLQKVRDIVPPWMPMIGIEGGRINIVPVDFVADALDYLAHKKGLDGKCFHLTDPEPHRIGEVLNIFARAGHAPQMTMRINAKMFGFIPAPILYGLGSLAPVKRAIRVVLTDLGIPRDVFQFVNWPTRYDNREAAKALKGSGIEVPRLETLCREALGLLGAQPRPGSFHRPLARRPRQGQGDRRHRLVVGHRQGDGARARRPRARRSSSSRGARRSSSRRRRRSSARAARRWIYPADIADIASCDALVHRVHKEHGGCDFLVNNAGRSIRRGVINSFDRFHDFERTMQLNYFGALRLIMGFLPKMLEKKRGHIINISSIGVLSNAPRFSAYVASKAALDSFSACAASEFLDKGIHFTTINMPLVRTPMIAPTKIYESVPTLSPEEAADLVVQAIVHRPVRIATRLGIFGAVSHAIAPKLTQVLLNTAFNMFPDSSAAAGKKGAGAAAAHARADGVRPDYPGHPLVGSARKVRRGRPLSPRRRLRGARQFRRDERRNTRRPARARCGRCRASAMFSAPSSCALVCGATIESCHDHSDTTRTPAGATSARLSSASHALPRPQLAERSRRERATRGRCRGAACRA